MKKGDIVAPKPEGTFTLRSGCESYTMAIVVSTNPLVLVSKGTDMRWEHSVKEEYFNVIGEAGSDLLNACMRRLLN